jgi:hypothetical protein
MNSNEYLAALERRKIESGGTRIPSLDEWGKLIDLTLREQDMNYQRPFTTRRPSQRYDFHRMPVEGSYAMRQVHNRRFAYGVLGILAVTLVILLIVVNG